MGVVYKASDIRLGRNVALKFVKAHFSQRWEREARLVAALNHPHIATLYDVGEHEGSPYLAMEFVEGRPIKGPRSPKTVVEYGIQIADALAAAHAANIVHRDLKPANILVTDKGWIKVLDFGLARLTEIPVSGTVDVTQTALIAGTPGYMAPEQFEGVTSDTRIDIFAFGCVLYELFSGRRAFPATSIAAAIAATTTANPAPLGGVPDRLEELILRCLRKDPERRYQSMVEVKIALEDLRDGLLETSSISGLYSRPVLVKKRPGLAGLLTVLALAVAAAGGWWVWGGKSSRSEKNAAPLQITRITTEGGLNIDPAISPDGKLLAYASDHGGADHLNLWVRQIGGGDSIRLTNDAADDVEPNFSPDGTRIVFRSSRDGGGLYLIPALGGPAQKLIDGGHRPQFSPDGSKIAYWTGIDNPLPLRSGTGRIFIFDLATSTTRPLREDFAADIDPVWSPDGNDLLFLGLKDAGDLIHTYDWWVTPLAGGQAVQCHVSTTDEIFYPFAWRANQVYLRGWEGRVGVVTLDSRTWQAAGERRRLTTGTTEEDSPSVSKDGSRLVFASLTGNHALYQLPLDANRGKPAGEPRRLTSNAADNFARSISMDGKRIAFISNLTGSDEVWVSDLATGQESELTTGGKDKWFPIISPDGKLVAWKVNSVADPVICATPFAGGATIQLCADCGSPDAWSPDRKWLFYHQSKNGIVYTSILNVASGKGGDYLRDSQLGFQVSSISNDGRWIAFSEFRTPQDFEIYVAPFSPDKPPTRSEWVSIAHSPKAHPNARWSASGSMLYFSSEQDGHACLWAEHLDPITKHPRGEPFAVQHFHSPSLPMAAPSFTKPVVLASDKTIVSLRSRAAGIWMLKLQE